MRRQLTLQISNSFHRSLKADVYSPKSHNTSTNMHCQLALQVPNSLSESSARLGQCRKRRIIFISVLCKTGAFYDGILVSSYNDVGEFRRLGRVFRRRRASSLEAREAKLFKIV